MAKKSNKTAHVLNLISNSKHVSVESESTPVTTNTQSIEEINPTIKQSLEKAAKSEALSNMIRDNLEKEFDDNKNQIKNNTNTTVNAKTNIEENNTIAKTLQNDDVNHENSLSQVEPTKSLDLNFEYEKNDEIESSATTQNSQLNNTQTIQQQPIIDTTSNIKQEPQENFSLNDEDKKTEDTDFLFINVCEKLVQEHVNEYMERFNVCKCKRCVADTMALALSNLPPKYVVVNDKNDIPFINFYESKYRILLMTELTKACLKVIESPRHNK